MVSQNHQEGPRTIVKILQDPEISADLKILCFRLSENPVVEKLLEQTPISGIFEICEEYRKHIDLYDDVFNGRIKYLSKGPIRRIVPIFNHSDLTQDCNLKKFFGPRTLIGQIVEKFVACGAETNRIRRVMIQVNGNKLMTIGFDHDNKIVSMLVDVMNAQNAKDDFIKFLQVTANRRLELIRF